MPFQTRARQGTSRQRHLPLHESLNPEQHMKPSICPQNLFPSLRCITPLGSHTPGNGEQSAADQPLVEYL